MKTFNSPNAIAIVALNLMFLGANLHAASPTPSGTKSDAELRKQIAELQAKVKQLEAAHSPHHQKSPSPSMPNMSSSPSSSPMSMSMHDDMSMNSMASASPGMSPMPNQPMGDGMMMDMMKMMGPMKMPMPSGPPGMSNTPQSALPGFPGISHLYHIGATGFFLDHAQHINLTADQQTALGRIKEQALAAKTHSDQQIEQAERDLGELTSADQPDAAKIEGKVREIEKLRGDERLGFIKAVGEAAKLLTDEQRKVLVGAMSPSNPMASPSMSPMPHM